MNGYFDRLIRELAAHGGDDGPRGRPARLVRATHAPAGVFQAAADAVENTTRYYAWRSIFADILECAQAPSASARRDTVLTRLAGDERLLALAPLLNPVLRLDLPDTELTAQLQDEARADRTQGLLLELLAREPGRCPTVFILEDAHWFDSASWDLTRRVLREHPEHLGLLSTRPILDSAAAHLKEC